MSGSVPSAVLSNQEDIMATTEETEPIDNVDDYLERNARILDVETQKDSQSDSWKRATSEAGQAAIEPHKGVGRWWIQLPDGDPHEVVVVKETGGDIVGACDCDGFRFHGEPCAHLCSMAQLDVLESVIPTDDDRAKSLAFDIEPDVVEEDVETAADRIEDNQTEVVEAEVVQEDNPDRGGDDNHDRGGEIEAADRPDPPANAFSGELPDVDDAYVMELDGSPYIRRAGYARLARAEGLRLELEEIVGAHETDWQRAKYAATVRDQEGNHIANDVGSSYLPQEDMSGAEGNLDELAASRAACRALAWGTGEGLTAVAEIAEEEVRQAP